MNKMKKFASIATAVLMTACMAAPMTMSLTASAVDIVVTADSTDTGTHSYEAYQIFKGTLAGGVLSNIEWGTGVDSTKYNSIYTALAEISVVDDSGLSVNPFTATGGSALTSASDVATVLGNYTTFDNDVAKKFASIIGDNLSGTTSGTPNANGVNGITEAGYYLVQDSSSSPDDTVGNKNSGAKTRYILNIVDTSGTTLTVTEKAVAPTVDKQVLDETTDAESGSTDGWGETADHDINESFDFKLIANLPADTEYESYEKYKVVFNDKMSTGVTFEGIDSVKVDNVVISASDYTLSNNVWDSANNQYIALAGNGTAEWTLTIADIKSISGVDLSDGATIEVIYSAHLNESASVTKSGANENLTNTNRNDVYLQYSNNPNVTGTGAGEELGKTPNDSVWVFTYEVDNTKYANSKADGNELAGAGFTLYDSTGTTEIGLIYDNSLSAYRPIKADETAEEMLSATDTGKFDIKGLDAGTYILKETKTPDGYNTCADIEIVIGANHSEEANTSAKVVFTSNTKGMSNDIINKAGSSLPSTGGIGTTLFYVGGGAMVAVAGVFLITKKRMGRKED